MFLPGSAWSCWEVVSAQEWSCLSFQVSLASLQPERLLQLTVAQRSAGEKPKMSIAANRVVAVRHPEGSIMRHAPDWKNGHGKKCKTTISKVRFRMCWPLKCLRWFKLYTDWFRGLGVYNHFTPYPKSLCKTWRKRLTWKKSTMETSMAFCFCHCLSPKSRPTEDASVLGSRIKRSTRLSWSHENAGFPLRECLAK